MTLLSIPAAAEILDDTPRHIAELIAAGELTAVDVAVHRGAKRGTTEGRDGKRSPDLARRPTVAVPGRESPEAQYPGPVPRKRPG